MPGAEQAGNPESGNHEAPSHSQNYWKYLFINTVHMYQPIYLKNKFTGSKVVVKFIFLFFHFSLIQVYAMYLINS